MRSYEYIVGVMMCICVHICAYEYSVCVITCICVQICARIKM